MPNQPRDARSSSTAELACAIRAHHNRYASPPVFRDDRALMMCESFWRTIISSRFLSWLVVDGILGRLSPIISAVWVRARYGEDHVEQTVQRGIRQYVIVGAGFDTFALRRSDLMEQLSVYELDQEATQAEKRRRMQQANLPEPTRVEYVAVDLNSESLDDALGQSRFEFGSPALISWFGVTYYLEQAAVETTLNTITSHMAPGTSVLFDYLGDEASTPELWRALRKRCAAFVARQGEPWISSFYPETLPRLLGSLGFSEIEHLSPDDVGSRFVGSSTSVPYPPFFGLCHVLTSNS